MLYILEKDGKLHALIEWFFDYPLKEDGPDRFRFPDYGLYAGEALVFTRDAAGNATQVEAASVVFARRQLDGEGRQDLPDQAASAGRGAPPRGRDRRSRPPRPGQFRQPDLVELITLDPTIKLDIRYATTNNFLGVPVYTSARAFMQRPAAEALVRAHRSLAQAGLRALDPRCLPALAGDQAVLGSHARLGHGSSSPTRPRGRSTTAARPST